MPNPSPDKYKTTTNREGFFETDPKIKKRNKSAELRNKVDPKAKRGHYIDNMEKYEAKHKPPGIGKYDITKDPYKKKFINLKPKELPRKFNNYDDVKFLSNNVPGAGHYNPHVISILTPELSSSFENESD